MSRDDSLAKLRRGLRLVEEAERELRAEESPAEDRPISDVERVRARNMKLRKMGARI